MPVEVHSLFPGRGAPPARATDFSLHEIGVDLAMQLNDTWHSVLPDTNKGSLLRNKRKAFYGFEFDGKWYAVGIWTDPVAGNRLAEPSLELRRLAIDDSAPRNTATRMLRLMREDLRKRFPDIRKVISYQAKSYHRGTIYKADNWLAVSETKGRQWSADYADLKNKHRRRKPTQAADSDKVRWERYL